MDNNLLWPKTPADAALATAAVADAGENKTTRHRDSSVHSFVNRFISVRIFL